MKILALETSAKSVSVAVVEQGAPLCSSYQNLGLTHSVTLMPLLDSMLKNADLTLEDIDAVAVANGPGSFTGLRIGVSAAKGLAWSMEKPCCAVSTLEAMAQNVRHMDGYTIICAMDARRNQVYNALFSVKSSSLTRLCPDRAVSIAELAEGLKKDLSPKVVVGDGASLCCRGLRELGIDCTIAPPSLVMQNAVGVGIVGEEIALRGETVSSVDLVPVYLRLSQAERERLAKGLKITLD